jgi:hypothetical protein
MKKRIGELLIDAGVITESIIATALRDKKENEKIGDYLVGKGYVKEETLYEKLSEQLKTPLFKLSEISFKPNVMDVIDKEILKKNVSFPVELSGSLLTVAMADPLDENSIKELENASEFEISAVLATKSEILDYINKFYDIDDSIQEFFNSEDLEISDKNELHVVDVLTSIIKTNGNFSIVIGKKNKKAELLKGEFGKSTPKELNYLLNFVKKMTGYTEDSNISKFEVVMNREDGSKIHILLNTINRGIQLEFWIEARIIELVELEGNDKLSSLDNSGLVFVLNPLFKKREDFINSLVGLNKGKHKNRLLICTDDIYYEGFGIKTLSIEGSSNLKEFSVFGDVFVFVNGWELEIVDSVIDLLSKNKLVILQLPFGDKESYVEYLSSTAKGNVLLKLMNIAVIL